MVRPRRRQRGIGMGGIFLTILLAAFVGTVLVRLGPAYMSFWTLRSVMKGVATSPEPVTGGKRGILDLIGRRLDINDVEGIDPKAFKIEKTGEDSYEVTVAYERREHLFFNIDAVMAFKHAVKVQAQAQ